MLKVTVVTVVIDDIKVAVVKPVVELFTVFIKVVTVLNKMVKW